jgi:tripartite-type tricarboxylate transporter receptor subunit TctC
VAPGSSITSYPHMRIRMPYDSLADLAPVMEIAIFSYVLVRHPGVPARNIRELIALARHRPGFLTFASPGIGTAFHLSGELLKNMANIDMVHVPYKGGTAAMTDMLAGRIDLLFYSLAVVQPMIEAKRLAPIAVTGRTRMAQLPGVPTIDESGVKGFEMTGWQGMFAPAKTPASILAQVSADVASTFADSAMKTLWAGQGMEFAPNTPAEFTSMVRRDYDRYARLIKLAGIPRE